MDQYKVQRAEAENFAKVWNKGGIYLPLQPAHIDFATDFANVVLRSFIGMCQQQAKAAQKPIADTQQQNTLVTES